MRIHFERTGGVAGMRMAAIIDTDGLSVEEAHSLEQMVDAAGFFDLPVSMTSPARGADQFHYKVTVEREGRRHTIEAAEGAAPEALRALLQRCSALARPRRGR